MRGLTLHPEKTRIADMNKAGSHFDQWLRGRLRTILRKRGGGKGRSRGNDRHRWPNHYFAELGLYCLLEARELEIISLRNGANH